MYTTIWHISSVTILCIFWYIALLHAWLFPHLLEHITIQYHSIVISNIEVILSSITTIEWGCFEITIQNWLHCVVPKHKMSIINPVSPTNNDNFTWQVWLGSHDYHRLECAGKAYANTLTPSSVLTMLNNVGLCDLLCSASITSFIWPETVEWRVGRWGVKDDSCDRVNWSY